MQDERSDGETVHARRDDGWRWAGRPYAWQWMSMQDKRSHGKLSMQEGMMDGDGRVRPYGWQWNVNARQEKSWGNCPCKKG